VNPGENTAPPAWYDPARIAQVFDARPLIEAGQHPLPQVMEAASALTAGEILELVTPFEPAPLIEKVRALGLDAWVRRAADGAVQTYFRKP
jgi:uncharacterized protein (DUF2249 family)